MLSKKQRLDLISSKATECVKCPSLSKRQNMVFGEGNPNSRIVFLGEGPGQTEDETGRPFVGPAGQLLDKIISACGWQREDVYICNVVKCVAGDVKVRTPQGLLRIDHMVKHRYSGDVLCVDDHGQIVRRPVTGWYRTPLGGRQMAKILLKHSRQSVAGTGG